MLYLNLHTKTPDGWMPSKSAPLLSGEWDKFDRNWIEWMQEHDSTLVTVGHTMYEIVSDEE